MIKTIITDIEGTTTSISFVHEVLFPYSSKSISTFLSQQWKTPVIQQIIADAASLAELENPSHAEITKVLLQWIQEDRKASPLKQLQGLIWKAGYEAGELEGHVYEDAHYYLKVWQKQGVVLSIFSSGSVEAQKLLFRHSCFGNMEPLFSFFFDTTTGKKQSPDAYLKILCALDTRAESVLFLSDVEEELNAAKETGIHTCQLLRCDEKHQPVSTGRHHTANDFREVTDIYRISQKP